MVEYLTERAPDLDHTSLRSIARNLCRLFWRDLEIHHPGIDSLHLAPEVARAWKERLAWIRDADGRPVRPRVNFRSELVFVKAFYEDIARWAADDPARWARWVTPCPVKASECATKNPGPGSSPGWTSGPGPSSRCCPPSCELSSSSARPPDTCSPPPGMSPPATCSPSRGSSSSGAGPGRPAASMSSRWPPARNATSPTKKKPRSGRGRPWRSCARPASGSRRCWSSPTTASSPTPCPPPARSSPCSRSPPPKPTPRDSCWSPRSWPRSSPRSSSGSGEARRPAAGLGLRRVRTDLERADAVPVPAPLRLRGPPHHPQLHPRVHGRHLTSRADHRRR